MTRPVWSGRLRFGLVTVAVRLYTAVEARQVSFRQFEEGTDQPIRYQRVAEGTDRTVDYEDVVKGYELPGGDYVMLTQEELESAQPEKTRAIEITDFVELADIDPIYYDRAYYLGPGDADSERPYVLLRSAMDHAGLAGIASFVMRGKEYLAAVRASGKLLLLQTMHFADEIRAADDVVERTPGRREVDKRELDTAAGLIEQLTTSWDPRKYHDSYHERLLNTVRQKAKGETVRVEPDQAPSENVVDLMDALERSVQRARDGTKPKPAKRRKSARSGTSDLADLNKQDLYRRAGNLGVSGRSKMTRDQLENAVRKAS